MEALNVTDFEKLAVQDSVIIDTRNASILKHGFIKGSIALPSIEKFKEYARFFAGFDLSKSATTSVLLVGNESEKDSWINEIKNWGIDVKGYLAGGFDAWKDAELPVDIIIDIEPDELMMDIPFDENLIVIDTRPEIAFGNGHLKEAVNMPLLSIADPLRLSAIEEKDNLYLIGSNDEEVFLAASVLKKHDIHNLRVVLGGWPAVQQQEKAEVVKEPGMLN